VQPRHITLGSHIVNDLDLIALNKAHQSTGGAIPVFIDINEDSAKINNVDISVMQSVEIAEYSIRSVFNPPDDTLAIEYRIKTMNARPGSA